jgi:hypothetical protein
MADATLFYECFLCKRSFQFGRYIYEGNYIAEWGLNVCHKCRADSWNGIDPATYPHAESVLKYRSVPFRLNSKGRIEIPKGCPPQPLAKSNGSRR